MKLSLNSQVLMAKDVVSCDLEGETAILNMKDGLYYRLEGVGSSVWNLIQEPTTLEQVLEGLLEIYEVEREECQRDLYELMKQLIEKELIEVNE
jgi:hypothetical protein